MRLLAVHLPYTSKIEHGGQTGKWLLCILTKNILKYKNKTLVEISILQAKKSKYIATVSIGYADGIFRKGRS